MQKQVRVGGFREARCPSDKTSAWQVHVRTHTHTYIYTLYSDFACPVNVTELSLTTCTQPQRTHKLPLWPNICSHLQRYANTFFSHDLMYAVSQACAHTHTEVASNIPGGETE